MPHPEQLFRWTWEFVSPPAALWPLVSNTDRFNRDCGYPPVTVVPSTTAHRRLRATVMGIVIEWEEHSFEWQEPTHFGVERIYSSGPVSRMLMRCTLSPTPAGGTSLVYEMRLTPSGLLGRLALPLSIGRQARATTERVLRKYDDYARQGVRMSQLAQRIEFTPGALSRLDAAQRALLDGARQPEPIVSALVKFVRESDDLSAQRMRAYVLADQWRTERRDTLKTLLHATRVGLLDFHWDVLCPHCRGTKSTATSLSTLNPTVHCDTCAIDFTANFDQSVELTFTPNASVRTVTRVDYCVGGPQVTPHVVAQQMLESHEDRPLVLALKPGRYRVRAANLDSPRTFRIDSDGHESGQVTLSNASHPVSEPRLRSGASLHLRNDDERPRLVIVEHVSWSDQSTTAAEVTSLQLFRDLFAREVLRPGGQISVGALTVVFTDLKNSTQLYKEIGDAPAFGRVLTHFEILKTAVAAEGGAIVKTMGDAIMAVFPQPCAALRALVRAQRYLARPDAYQLPEGMTMSHAPHALALKAGLHHGPCIAINQNERLDYFGTTVNIAARLCALGTGEDLVLSESVRQDPGVSSLLNEHATLLGAGSETAQLKGFGAEQFEVWRLKAHSGITQHPFWRL